MTFMTASTKLGEIPESRWRDMGSSPGKELGRIPYTVPPPLAATEPKRRKGLKFWKKEAKSGGITAD